MVPVRLRSWSLWSTSGAMASMLTVTWLEGFSFDVGADGAAFVGADVADGVAGAAGAISAESPADCASGSVPEPWSASATGRAATGHSTRPATPSRAAMVTIALLRSREPSVVTTFAHR